jgi:sugar lactone lactonase YvrE/L-rhamnose mutarotase
VALATGPALLDLATGGTTPLLKGPLEPERPLNRCNDGKCGPDGRLYFGTMHGPSVEARPTTGSLYVLDHDGSVRLLVGGVTISNGIAWSPDGRTMYFIDTPTRRVDAFDFDGAAGAVSNRRVAFTIPEGEGNPDGCATDSAGNVWVAMWGGSSVLAFSPSGAIVARVQLPTTQVSSVAFGGPSLTDLYITTAKEFLDADARAAQPLAGHVFTVRDCGFTGTRSHAYAHAPTAPAAARRIGMVTELREECAEEYARVHADGFPGVRDLLATYGLRNFNIYTARLGGKLYEFAHHEYVGSDFSADMAALEAEPRNAVWHKLCDPMQVHPCPEGGGSVSGGSAWHVMAPVFFNA